MTSKFVGSLMKSLVTHFDILYVRQLSYTQQTADSRQQTAPTIFASTIRLGELSDLSQFAKKIIHKFSDLYMYVYMYILKYIHQ